MCVLYWIVSAFMDDFKNGILLLFTDSHAGQRLTYSAIWADLGPVILPRKSRITVVGLPTFGADSDPNDVVLFHFATSTL